MMKKIIILFIAVSVSFSCTNTNSQVQSASMLVQEATIAKNVAAKNFEKLIQTKKNAIVLDVRTQGEVNKGHLANSVNIDYYAPDFKEKISRLDKTKAILVYCHSGRRSSNAMAVLQGMGFVEVYNLESGIAGWQAAGLPIEK